MTRQGQEDAPLAQEEPQSSLSQRHLRGSTLLTVGLGSATVINLVTQVVLVRALSKPDFGLFALGLAVSATSPFVLSLGQGRALSRFMSIYHEHRDYARLLGTLVLAAATVMAMSLLLFLAAVLFADDIAKPASPGVDSTTVLLVLVWLSPIEAVDRLFAQMFAVFSKPRSIFFRKYLLNPGLRLVVVLCLALLGQDVMFLAVGYVTAGIAGIGVYVVLAVHLFREQNLLGQVRWREIVLPTRDVTKFSLVMLSNDLLLISMSTISLVLLSHFAGLVELAAYRAVLPAARLIQLIYGSFGTLFLPLASRLHERNLTRQLHDAYWRSAILVTLLAFPVFAMAGPFAPATTTKLFGDRYADSAAIMAILAVGFFINVALGLNTMTLQVYERLRFVLVVNCGSALLNVVLSVPLIMQYGALGVAVANALTLVMQTVLSQWGLRPTLGTAFIEPRYLGAHGLMVGAAAVLWAVQFTLSPGFVVSAICVVVVTGALVLVLRRRLELAELFPELTRVPVLGRLVT